MPQIPIAENWLPKVLKPPRYALFNADNALARGMKICLVFNEPHHAAISTANTGDRYTNYANPNYPAFLGASASQLSWSALAGEESIAAANQSTTPGSFLDFCRNGAASVISGLSACTMAARLTGSPYIPIPQPAEILAGEDNTGNQQDMTLRVKQGATDWEVSVGTTGTSATVSTPTIAQNFFQDIAATFDGANLKLYLSGTLATSAAATGTLTSNSTHLVAMGTQRSNSQNITSQVSYIYLWNRALSAGEISSLAVNPYQMFTVPSRLFIASAAAAGTPIRERRTLAITGTRAGTRQMVRTF